MRPIPGYENYSITPEGKIFRGDKEIVRRDTVDGYPRVRLTTPTGLKNLKVHRLVASTYLDGFNPDKHEVRHLDNTRSNVSLDNLAVGDRGSNAQDRLSRGSYHYKTKVINGKSWLISGNKFVLPEKHLVVQVGPIPALEHQEDGVRYVTTEAEMTKLAWTSPSNAHSHAKKHSVDMGLTERAYIKKAIDAKTSKLKLIKQSLDGSKKLRDPEGNILVLSRTGKVITYYTPSEKVAMAIEGMSKHH